MRTGIDIPVRFRYNEDTAVKGVMIMKFIDYDRVALTDGFWKEVRSRNAAVSLKNVYRRFAETGRFSAVACVRREDPPHIFYDSDVAKWLEAAAYLQKDYPDAEIRAIIDETVDTIARSQLACGYFNSYYQVYKPDKIFTERTEHELYCAGHLIEAAVALDACGVNGKLLAVMKKYAEYIYDRFYVKRDTGFTTCGHPEIELALVRLYTHTGERKWLTLAQFFIDERGKRAEEIYPTVDRTYDQSHKPVREQTEAVGHAVRALYLYIAMADVGRLTGDDTLVQVCETLFQDIVNKKMYLTGGTGSSNVGERFTIAYDLPNQTAYSETCSAIALAFFAERMARVGNKAAYHAVVERVLYNNVLAGESLDGKGFFYTNPLEMHAAFARYARTLPDAPYQPIPERVEVFDCSCCPPNLIRFFAQIGGFAYGEEDGVLYVHQYISSRISACGCELSVQSEMPFSGKATIGVKGSGRIALRIPVWQSAVSCAVNGAFCVPETRDDYMYFSVEGETCISLDFEMKPRFVYANEKVWADAGRKAVEYGPLVLCAESADNGGDLASVEIPSPDHAEIGAEGGFCVKIPARRLKSDGALYSYLPPAREAFTLVLRPYYTWANRGENDMQVWFL